MNSRLTKKDSLLRAITAITRDLGDYMIGFHVLHSAAVNGAVTGPACVRITASGTEQKLLLPVFSLMGVAVTT